MSKTSKKLAWIGAVALAALTLAGCSSGRPYVHSTVADAASRMMTARVCYNSSFDTQAEVLTQAEKACGEFNARPSFLYKDFLACSISRPWRATYACQPLPPPVVVAPQPEPEPKLLDPDLPPELPKNLLN